ncbi:MAG: LLM class flavin-dependent oxidoreductase [Aggregatilineales bacterium]
MAGRLGVSVSAGNSLPLALERVKHAEALGIESIWVNQLPAARDTPSVLAAFALATGRIGLGTLVLPIYTRHPTAMAQMALTIDELCGGRFQLGIGVSHKLTVERMWGLQLIKPVEAMREYVGIVRSLVAEGVVSTKGTYFTARTAYEAPRREAMLIHISALSPRMLELAGELADGVALWMCAPDYIRDVVVPRVRAGREKAGKSLVGFDVIASVPVCLTTDRLAGLEAFRQTTTFYASLPYYRRVLDQTFRDMSDFPNDRILASLAGIGSEVEIREAVKRYRQAGTTLPVVAPFAAHPAAANHETTVEVLTA